MKFYLKSVALFMIVLIISITFNIAIVLADDYGVTVTKASGSDGIYDTATYVGWQRYMDDLTINLQVTANDATGVTVDKVKVKRGTGSYYSVESCSGGTSGTCSLTQNGVISTGRIGYQAAVFDDSGNEMFVRTFEIISDYTAPEVTAYDVLPEKTNTGEFVISYDIKDWAYGNVPGIGIKEVRLYEDNVLVQTTTLPPNTMSKVGSFDYASSQSSGVFEFCVEAIDNFDQVSDQKCLTRIIDRVAPVATGMELTDAYGKDFEYISNNSVPGIVTVNFDSTDLDRTSTLASFPDITGNDHWIIPNSCSGTSNGTKCTWRVNVLASTALTPSADVTFSDLYGNNGTASLSSNEAVGFDSTPPVYSNLKANHGQMRDGTWLLLSENDFELTVNERDLGGNKPALDLSDIGGPSTLEADYCNQTSANMYKCYWDDVSAPIASTIDDGTFTVSTVNTVDALNNMGGGLVVMAATVDTSSPVFLNMDTEVVHASQNAVYGNRTLKGDALKVTATIEEEGTVLNVMANFSNLITTQDNVAGVCSKYDNKTWNCTWETLPIDTDNLGVVDYYFTASDELSNNESNTESLFLWGIINDTDVNYWNHEVICSPSALDRETSELINLRSYCSVSLNKLNDGADITPVEVSLGSCYDTDNYTADFIRSEQLFNNLNGSTSPIIRLEFEADRIDNDNLGYTCPITVLSQIVQGGNKYVTTSYEYENVSMAFSMYNLPLGEYSGSIKDKIREVQNDGVVAMEWAGKMLKLINIFGKLCEIYNMIMSVYSAFELVHEIIVLIGWYPPAKGAVASAETTGQGLGTGLDGVGEAIGEFCAYVSCSKSLWNIVWPDAAEKTGAFVDQFEIEFNMGGDSDACSSSFASFKADVNSKLQAEHDSRKSAYDKCLEQGTSDCKKEKEDYEKFSTQVKADDSESDRVDNGEVQNRALTSDDQGYKKQCTSFKLGVFPDNPKDSLILSLATLCLPGVLQKVEEWRQIQCNYGTCLIDAMRMNMPISVCEEQRGYLECKYLTGEIFNMIPWFSVFKQLLQSVRQLLNDPFALVFGLGGMFICGPLAPVEFSSNSPVHATCLIVEATAKIMALIEQLTAFFENMADFAVGEEVDMCEEFNTKLELVGMGSESEE